MIITSSVLAAAAALFVGCKRENNESLTEQSPGTVVFAGAGVSIEVGDGWKRIDLNPGPPVCPPTLVGEHGIVRAMLLASDRSGLQKAVAGLRSTFDSNPEAVRDSFRQEEFAAKSGLRGLHVSYAERAQKDEKAVEMRTHNYIVMNRAGQCVAVSYIATVASDSDVVHQMMRDSLRLL